MAWFLDLLAYASLVVASILIHVVCIAPVPVGFCEVKFRALRWGRKKYGIMTAGKNFVIPVIQSRYHSTTDPGALFPIVKGAGPLCETGLLFAESKSGVPLVVEAVFTYFVDDAQTFVEKEFVADLSPYTMARHQAREQVVAAVERMRTRDDAKIAPSIMRNLAKQTTSDSDTAIQVEFLYIKRCAITKDLSVVAVDDRDSS